MTTPYVTLPGSRDGSFLGARIFSGIGASFVPTVMGLNPWEKRPLEEVLWEYAHGLGGGTNARTEAGIRFEGVVLDWWCEHHGYSARRNQDVLQSVMYPFLLATPDAYLVNEQDNASTETHVEVKATGYPYKNGILPMYVYIQVQAQLLVLGNERGHVAHWSWGEYPEDYVVERDERVQQQIIERSERAWDTIRAIRGQ